MATLQIHAPLAIAAAATLIPICSLSVGLRIYVRKIRKVGLAADDYLIMAALVFVVGMGITILAEIGLHQLGYPAPEPSTVVGKPDSNIAFYPGELLQIPALGLVKLSLIFFYRRVFTRAAAPIFHIVTLIIICIVILWTLSFFFSILFICGTNFSAYWASTIVEKEYCVDTGLLHNAFAISDVVTDFVIICLPVPMIFGLRLTFGRKIGITAIFGLGALTIAASIVRMVVFIQATAVNYDPHADFEFICTAGLYWSMIESGLGVLAACLPAQYGLLSTAGIQSIIGSVRSAISLRSVRSTSQNIGAQEPVPGQRQGGGCAYRYGLDAKSEQPWASTCDTQYMTSSVEGPERTRSHESEEEDVELGMAKMNGGIVVTNSFESREGTI